LEKDPKRRLRDIADAMALIDEGPDESAAAGSKARPTWPWMAVAAAAVLIAAAGWWYATRPAPLRALAGTRWLSPRLDYLAYRHLAARGELSAARWLASLAAAPKVYDLFAWTDPMPLAVVLWDEVKHLPRLGRRVMRWLSTAS